MQTAFNQTIIKTKIRILILLIFLPFAVSAQWYEVNSNTDENLNDIFFVDSSTGYCVGGDAYGFPEGDGIVLKTTDGGENWTALFSQDSLAIRSVVITEQENNLKLYGFALKNGASFLVSTFVSSEFQNWTVEPITYRPMQVQLFGQSIYFIDGIDFFLKKMEQNETSTITSNVSIFYVNNDGLYYLNSNVDSLHFSSVSSNALDFHKKIHNGMGSNQITNAKIKAFGDILVVKGTYPGLVIQSADNGDNWELNYLAPENFLHFRPRSKLATSR